MFRLTLWNPYMLHCRTKLPKFECLKYRGRTSRANLSAEGTVPMDVAQAERSVQKENEDPRMSQSGRIFAWQQQSRTQERVSVFAPMNEIIGIGIIDHSVPRHHNESVRVQRAGTQCKTKIRADDHRDCLAGSTDAKSLLRNAGTLFAVVLFTPFDCSNSSGKNTEHVKNH